jgi:sirohydrochlorin ferrochelatase
MPEPALIACAHGTNNADGRRRINQLRADMAVLRPGLEVLESYVDVQDPALPDVVGSLPGSATAVVVPLLLSVGYHVRVDIADAVASRPELLAAGPLGPDPRLAQLLHERLGALDAASDEAGASGERWGIVLAAAGSSNPEAAASVEELAADLQALRDEPVLAGYGASAEPSVPDAVARLRADGCTKVAIASYLLAPGYFHDQLGLAGADWVSAPLLPSPLIAELALERYDAAVAG